MFKEIHELLLEQSKKDLTDEELREKLKNIDILYLFKALYFSELENEDYRRRINKLRNQGLDVECRLKTFND